MQPLTLKQPLRSTTTEFQITAEITSDDCARLGLGNEYIGWHTFGPKRWEGITHKKCNSIKAMAKNEEKSRKVGNPPRDMRCIVGLEKVPCHRGGAGKPKKKDIKRMTPSAKYFIYGLKRENNNG